MPEVASTASIDSMALSSAAASFTSGLLYSFSASARASSMAASQMLLTSSRPRLRKFLSARSSFSFSDRAVWAMLSTRPSVAACSTALVRMRSRLARVDALPRRT